MTDSGLTSGTRWTIVGLLSASVVINLLDRQVFSVLAPFLRDPVAPGSPHWQWTNAEFGYVAVAFSLGMTCGQVPIGSLLDRLGTKIGLAFIFIAWSLLTMAHALAGPGSAIDSILGGIYGAIPLVPAITGAGLAGFVVLRFLLGLTQSGSDTAAVKALAGLFPSPMRSKAGGVFNAGTQLGSVIAPPLILVYLIQTQHARWQMAFVLPALIGLLWLVPWFSVFPDKHTVAALALKPATAGANAPASALSVWQLLANRKTLGLFLIRACTGPIAAFYWTWLPTYLRSPVKPDGTGGRGMTFLAIDAFALVPNVIGMGGNVIGGLITDRFVKRMGIDAGRKLAFVCAFSLGALSMTMPWVDNNYLAMVLMGLALFGNQWVAAAYIGTVGDVVPQQYAGRVNGIAGCGDSGAAALAVLLTGVIVDHHGWSTVFVGAGMLPLFAMASVFLVLRKIELARF